MMEDEPERMERSFLIEREGDLLEADQQYIVHQTNCISRAPKGLAASMFRRFPHADVYGSVVRSRRKRIAGDTPGTIAVMGEGAEGPERGVINLFGQDSPGRPRGRHETAAVRLEWFKQGLAEIAELPGLRSLAFPALIGCGLGAGNPTQYREALESFAAQVAEQGVVVVLYRERPPPRRPGRAARVFGETPAEEINPVERPAAP
jgi:O-acetyl-ADP-ribose deacetylase (regulator of RNase III)